MISAKLQLIMSAILAAIILVAVAYFAGHWVGDDTGYSRANTEWQGRDDKRVKNEQQAALKESEQRRLDEQKSSQQQQELVNEWKKKLAAAKDKSAGDVAAAVADNNKLRDDIRVHACGDGSATSAAAGTGPGKYLVQLPPAAVQRILQTGDDADADHKLCWAIVRRDRGLQ